MSSKPDRKKSWVEMDNEKAIKFARSFLQKAENDFSIAKGYLEKDSVTGRRPFYEKMWSGQRGKVEYSQSISLSLECIEFSTKAIFLIFLKKHPRVHGGEGKERIEEVRNELAQHREEINKTIKELSESSTQLRGLSFDRLISYWNYWLANYTMAKYGDEENLIPSEELFGENMAGEALEKAYQIKELARHVFNHHIVHASAQR
jgi:HEPN domain-containing protein